MAGHEREQDIRAAAALRLALFDDWISAKPESDSFAEIPWLDIVTAASLALLALDKNLKAANDVIDRLGKLYKWIVKKAPDESSDTVLLGEKIIVLLADERARQGDGLTVADIAARTMTPDDTVSTEIQRLKAVHIVIENDDQWTLRTAGDN